MNKIRLKLTSKSGASITYALLLFLVCAVVSTVVLAAGTAASGRMSKSVENDQRYYSVTSAAEFLKNQIDGRAWIRKTVTDGDTPGTPTLEGGIQKGGLLDVISSAAFDLKKNGTASSLKEFTITPVGEAYKDFTVKAAANIVNDTGISDVPVLKLTLENKTSKETDHFRIWMIFTSDIEWRESKDGVSKVVNVDKVSWSLYSISTENPAS